MRVSNCAGDVEALRLPFFYADAVIVYLTTEFPFPARNANESGVPFAILRYTNFLVPMDLAEAGGR